MLGGSRGINHGVILNSYIHQLLLSEYMWKKNRYLGVGGREVWGNNGLVDLSSIPSTCLK